MKVKALSEMFIGQPIKRNEVVEFPDHVAESLIRNGDAVAVDDDGKVIATEPEAPKAEEADEPEEAEPEAKAEKPKTKRKR